jgi:hypothetical protein
MNAPKKNFSRDFAKAVKEGWIHENGDKSYLTQSGENAVAAGFSGKAKARGRSAPTRRKAKKAT